MKMAISKLFYNNQSVKDLKINFNNATMNLGDS